MMMNPLLNSSSYEINFPDRTSVPYLYNGKTEICIPLLHAGSVKNKRE